MRRIVIALAALATAWGADDQLAFEVASVRPVPNNGSRIPGGGRGGPGTPDPAQLTFASTTLNLLVSYAFGVKTFQVAGPSWIETERYNVVAKILEGTTREQSRLMMQNLLRERFKLTVHHETRDFPAYDLTVGKGGPKFRESMEAKQYHGIDLPPPGRPTFMRGATLDGRVMTSAREQPLSVLLSFLEGRTGLTVIDKTGLTGTYDFAIEFIPPGLPGGTLSDNPADAASAPAPDVFAAVQEYLGLKLEEKKLPFDVIVIDSAEKTPEEN